MKQIQVTNIQFDTQGATPIQVMSAINAVQNSLNRTVLIPEGITPEEEMIDRAGGLQLDFLTYEEV
jgi:hypothetical protein